MATPGTLTEIGTLLRFEIIDAFSRPESVVKQIPIFSHLCTSPGSSLFSFFHITHCLYSFSYSCSSKIVYQWWICQNSTLTKNLLTFLVPVDSSSVLLSTDCSLMSLFIIPWFFAPLENVVAMPCSFPVSSMHNYGPVGRDLSLNPLRIPCLYTSQMVSVWLILYSMVHCNNPLLHWISMSSDTVVSFGEPDPQVCVEFETSEVFFRCQENWSNLPHDQTSTLWHWLNIRWFDLFSSVGVLVVLSDRMEGCVCFVDGAVCLCRFSGEFTISTLPLALHLDHRLSMWASLCHWFFCSRSHVLSCFSVFCFLYWRLFVRKNGGWRQVRRNQDPARNKNSRRRWKAVEGRGFTGGG